MFSPAIVLTAVVAATSLTGITAASAQESQTVGADSAIVEEWILPTEDGCRLFVREMGTGPLVVVLHGGWGREHSYLTGGFSSLTGPLSLHLLRPARFTALPLPLRLTRQGDCGSARGGSGTSAS